MLWLHTYIYILHILHIYRIYIYIYIQLRTKLLVFRKMPSPKVGGVPYRFCQLFHIGVSVFGGSLSIFEGSLSRLKVQGNFLRLCSSTSFLGYSCIHIRCLCVFGRETKHPNIVRARLGQFLLRS